MATLNRVELIGRVGKDPEIRAFQGGGQVANFTLATDEGYTDRNGQRVDAVEWHNIVVSGKQTEVVQNYVHKGSLLYIAGKIRTRSWTDQQNVKHFQTEVICYQLQLLDPKPQAQAPAPQPQYQQAPQAPAPGYTPAPQAPAPQYAPQPSAPAPQYAPAPQAPQQRYQQAPTSQPPMPPQGVPQPPMPTAPPPGADDLPF